MYLDVLLCKDTPFLLYNCEKVQKKRFFLIKMTVFAYSVLLFVRCNRV